MIQMQLISSVIEVERKIAFEEERQANRRLDPYVNYLAAPQRSRYEQPQLGVTLPPADFIRALNSNL